MYRLYFGLYFDKLYSYFKRDTYMLLEETANFVMDFQILCIHIKYSGM